MATADKTVKIIFQGEDKISKTMDTISSNLSAFSGKVTDITGPLADMAGMAVKTEAALAAMVVGGIVYATKEAGNFNDAFAEISTLFDATGAEVDSFREDIIAYGRDSSKSYEDITASVYSAISAGVDYKDSLGALSAAEKLSTAGKADLNSTMLLIAGTLNAYGESTDQASKYSDIFFQTVKLGQTTIPELASSLSKVTGIAAAGSVPIETLAASIAAVTASGLPTAEAITAIKAALSNIIKPSSEASKLAGELGIQFDASALKSKGFEGVLKEVYQATGGNVDQMAKMFGSTEALNAVLVLASDTSGKFAGALDVMNSASGSTEAAYGKMAANMGEINQNLVNNLKATVIEFGGNFLDEWGAIAGGVTDIFKGVDIAMDAGAFDKVIAFIEKAGQDLAGYLTKIAEALPEALESIDFDGLLDSVSGLGSAIKDAFEAFFGGVDLTTPEGLSDAIQKVVDSMETLTRITAGIVEGLTPFFAGLGKAVDGTNNLESSTKAVIGSVMGFASGVNTVVGALNTVGPALEALLVSGVLKNVVSLMGGLGVSIGSLGVLAVPAVITGGAVAVGVLAEKLATWIDTKTSALKQPKEIETKITLDDGNVLDLVSGIITDLTGKVVSIPVSFETDAEAAERSAQKVSADVKEALIKGASDAEINYIINPNLESLNSALKETGALVSPESFKAIDTALDGFFSDIDALDKKWQETELVEWFDSSGERHTLLVPVDADTKKAKEKVDEVTGEKALEIKMQGEIDTKLETIKTEAEVIQTAMEWTAKVKIAQAEADAKRLEAAFSSVTAEIGATSSAVTALFDNLSSGNLSIGQQGMAEGAIRSQLKMQEEAHEKNMALLDQEIKRQEIINKKMEKGDALIKLEAAGLQPHLEAIWFEIMKAIQVMAVERGSEFLLGI